MKVEFDSAVLSLAPADQHRKTSKLSQAAPARRPKVGWFVQTTDVKSASTRYRCLHFARALSPRFESLYFTSTTEAQSAVPSLDAIIIVKRLDRGAVDLVGTAKLFGVPVFLDLCDDLISPAYAKNDTGTNLVHFLGLAPLLAGITVPSAEMAERLQYYASTHGLSGPRVHVIPDVAETWAMYRSTVKMATGENIDPKLAIGTSTTAASLKRIVWFGNYGASHSSFGIFSLRPMLKALRTVHKEIPLELVVISNSEPVYQALVHACGFPTRYVRWSAEAVYAELAHAAAALLTTGDDDFCSIKSSNRVLQALASGVPVMTAKSAALAEFEDAIFSGNVEEALRLCLGPKRNRLVPQRLETARAALNRYTPERLGGIWASLLSSAITAAHDRRAADKPTKLLMVLEPGDSASIAKKLFSAARTLADVNHELLVSTELIETQPEFHAVLGKAPATPRFFSGDLKGRRNLLFDTSAVVVERPSAVVGTTLSDFAAQLGVPVIASAEALDGALNGFAGTPKRLAPPPSSIRAGPNEERLNADGSVDWSFVVHQNARGWILDAICREIGSRQDGTWKVSYFPERGPRAKNIFFSHYLLLQSTLERQPDSLQNSNLFVWYTHPREEDPSSIAALLLAFDKVSRVIFACESNRRIWLERGLPKHKTAVVLGAADPVLFPFHQRGGGVVGLSSSFYERKNPDCLLDVIKLLPHHQFVLVGRHWDQYALFEEMRTLPNFAYKTAPYRDYPKIYDSFDVFLSMSNLEGGPIPLIEAMMSNAVPVASRTGFAPDLIRHGENGFLFDLNASPEIIAELIEQAFVLPGDVRQTVEAYDWDHFSAEIVKLAR